MEDGKRIPRSGPDPGSTPSSLDNCENHLKKLHVEENIFPPVGLILLAHLHKEV
jgi:hypothetical protein